MVCTALTETSFEEFSREFLSYAYLNRIPIKGSFEVTLRCNLRCVHCYLGDERSGSRVMRELSLAEITALFDQMADEGVLWLLLTGGDPLIRPDFSQIYMKARRHGMLVDLFTNGTLLTPEIADILAAWPARLVEISLYGATQSTYEQVTGIPGSYARCMRGIELLLERKIPLGLKTMAMTLNWRELSAMQAYADSLGVAFRFDPLLVGGMNDGVSPQSLRLTPEEAVALDLQYPKRFIEWQEVRKLRPSVQTPSPALYSCGAGITTFHVDPYGRLSLCMLARDPSYAWRQGSFSAGWREFIRQERSREPAGSVPCHDCRLLPLCGSCPGRSRLEHGNPEEKVDYFCRVAHLRAEKLDALALRNEKIA